MLSELHYLSDCTNFNFCSLYFSYAPFQEFSKVSLYPFYFTVRAFNVTNWWISVMFGTKL
jgi:hypothetical protein